MPYSPFAINLEKNFTSKYLENLTYLEPQVLPDLMSLRTGLFYPIFSKFDRNENIFFLNAKNSSEIKLTETGIVGSLSVKNNLTKPLLILNGEIFEGAKQDRVSNETVLIPANSEMEIQVSCIEQNRWQQTNPFFRSGQYMFNYSAKGQKDLNINSQKHHKYTGDVQGGIWKSIHQKQRRMDVKTRFGSDNDTYKQYETKLTKLFGQIKTYENQTGLISFIRGKYIGFDLFNNNSLFENYRERIYKSHLIELLDKTLLDRRYSDEVIKNFLIGLMYGNEKVLKKNLGEELIVLEKQRRLSSSALIFENTLIHMTASESFNNFRRHSRS